MGEVGIRTSEKELHARLMLLLDILQRKKSALELIFNISENQGVVLNANDSQSGQLFKEMSNLKQANIDEVLNFDNVFQSLFDSVKDSLEDIPSDLKPLVADIQAEIKGVMDLDYKIRLQEEINKDMYSRLTKPAKPVGVVQKERMINQYKENSGKKK